MVNKSLFVETAHSVKISEDGTITDDDDGYIRLQLHEQIKPYLLNIDGSLDLAEDVVKSGFILEEGCMRLPEKPGLGLVKV